jgi:hypothetical protein
MRDVVLLVKTSLYIRIDVMGLSIMRTSRPDGVVGYRICLTHRRSPVRARVRSNLFVFVPIEVDKNSTENENERSLFVHSDFHS